MKRARISSDGLTICFCFNGFTEKLPSTCCREKDTEVKSTTRALLSRLKPSLVIPRSSLEKEGLCED